MTESTFLNSLESEFLSVRSGTTSEWETTNPVLQASEFGLDSETKQIKFGDGQTAWLDLPYLVSSETIGEISSGDHTHEPEPMSIFRGGRKFPSDLDATSVDPADSITGELELASTCMVLHVVTEYPTRVRVYMDSASQTADELRAIGDEPIGGNHGVLMDLVTTEDDLVWTNLNTVFSKYEGYPQDTIFPITLTNLDDQARVITATFAYVQLEGQLN